MKMNLRTRLIISHTALSLLLVFSLLFVANLMFEKQFNYYVQEKQEQKNRDYVGAVQKELETGLDLSNTTLQALGQKALNEGIILMVNDKLGNKIFCMSCLDNAQCENMLTSMESTMRKRYPNFEGEYTEKIYPITKDDMSYGTVKLGFYGPFYYNDADIRFMEVLNTLFAQVSVLFVLIAFGLGYYIANRISKPIKAVTAKTKEIEKGNYTDRIAFSSKTKEIDSLIDSVNALASTLEIQQDLKKRMARDYAHEFRTPLAAIQSNLEGIIDGVFEPTNERVESIRQEILRLSRMVSEIDKIAELSEDCLVLQKERFDFSELLKQNLLTFEAEMRDKNITLILNVKPCEIYADKDKISGVILNLISNAVKYTGNDGVIDIIVQSKKNSIIFTIADNGVGIDEADLPHIFEHFYRADVSRTRDTGGSGIGLSLVKAIVTAHGGEINVKSKTSVGSEFTVTLKNSTALHIISTDKC